LAACSPKADGGCRQDGLGKRRRFHPVSGLPVVPLTVAHGTAAHAFQVELRAASPDQAKGLMFRTSMGADEGMIFPMDPPRQAAFWMKNTVIPARYRLSSVSITRSSTSRRTPRPIRKSRCLRRARSAACWNSTAAARLRWVSAPGDRVDW
jgi:NAD-dependent oxidoreductase involved in siderophore biosynthesis